MMLCVMTACHAHFDSFSFFSFFLNYHFSLKLFLICSYFSGDLSLTVLIKCVLNKKKVYHKGLDFIRNRANTCSTLRADSLCVIFVSDFLRFSVNHCEEIRMEIFIMASESCAMLYFAGKKLCRCVSH